MQILFRKSAFLYFYTYLFYHNKSASSTDKIRIYRRAGGRRTAPGRFQNDKEQTKQRYLTMSRYDDILVSSKNGIADPFECLKSGPAATRRQKGEQNHDS